VQWDTPRKIVSRRGSNPAPGSAEAFAASTELAEVLPVFHVEHFANLKLSKARGASSNFVLQPAILTIFRATSLVLPHLSRDNRPTFRQSLLTCAPTMAKSLDVSPAKSFAEEVEILRKSFRACLDVYATRVEAELSHIKEATLAKTQSAQLSQNTIRDLRDMITLCRTLDIKPEKGRRKDLKKIDSLIDELNLMVENW
jgi:hypothetical protein